jgi:hypothetical protein
VTPHGDGDRDRDGDGKEEEEGEGKGETERRRGEKRVKDAHLLYLEQSRMGQSSENYK